MSPFAGAHAGPGEVASAGAGVGTGADAGAGASVCTEFMDSTQAPHLQPKVEQAEVGDCCFHLTHGSASNMVAARPDRARAGSADGAGIDIAFTRYARPACLPV